jgi:ribonuclease P protein component
VGSLKLPKSDLLRKGREFDQVYRQGKRLHGSGFSLIYYGNNLGHSRLGISVHRQLRGVVRRNRIKRLVRESFRLHRELYPQQSDIVLTVRPDWSSSDLAQVNATVAGLARRN